MQLAELAGLKLDPWQQLTLRAMLRRRADGRWSAYESLILVPRQNGKSVLLEAFDLAKLFLSPPGHLIMHTAHLFPTAMESFRHLLGLVQNTPELDAEVKRVSMAHGAEGIELHNGSRLRFAARGVNGAGRGFSPDDVVFDEAYRLPVDAESALVYAVSAKPNPQLVYASSTGFPDSTILWSLVERGRTLDDPSLMLAEWSANTDLDLDDPDQVLEAILEANPAVGFRQTVEKITAEHRKAKSQGALDEWCRERLGWWAETAGQRVIDLDVWERLTDVKSEPTSFTAYAIELTPDRAWAAIAGAGPREDGLWHVEAQHGDPGGSYHRRGSAWVVPWCVARPGRPVFVVDGNSPAATLIPELQEARLDVLVASTGDVARAFGMFLDGVAQGTLRHGPQQEFVDAIDVAQTRPCGDGGTAFGRKKSGADITVLVAGSLALWGARTHPNVAPGVWSLAEMVQQIQAKQDGQTPNQVVTPTQNDNFEQRPDGSRFIPIR